jgi:hypothetical protein
MAKEKNGVDKPRRSTTGGSGPRNVDQTNWRKKLAAHRIKFDDDQKQVFLDHFRRHGRQHQAAEAAGVSPNCVRDHLENDPDFYEAYQSARDEYKDHIQEQVYRLAVEGVDKPIIGGEFKDEIVAYEKVFFPNLLAMEAKRVNPEYRDKQEHVHEHKGGVLVAPARQSPADWAKDALEYKDKMPTEASWRAAQTAKPVEAVVESVVASVPTPEAEDAG